LSRGNASLKIGSETEAKANLRLIAKRQRRPENLRENQKRRL